MSGDPLRRLRTGERLRGIPGEAFNRFADVAEAYARGQQDALQPEQARGQDRGAVWIRNDTGADQARFAVLTVGDPVITPTDNEAEFLRRPAHAGTVPAVGEEGRFAILQEPAPTGKLARARLSGVVACKVSVTDAAHEYADIAATDATQLESRAHGSARILWKESGTGTVWARVRLGESPTAPDDNDGADLAVIPSGTTATADTTEWDITATPAGTVGVQVVAWFRLFWSGTVGEPVYQFRRKATYDAFGRLVAVGPEVRSTAFESGDCVTGS